MKYKYSILYIFLIIILFFLSFSLPSFFSYITLFLAFLPILKKAISELFYNKNIGTEFFLSIATVIALIGHEEKAITIVLIIMLISHLLEEIIEDRTNNAIESLIKFIPRDVIVQKNNQEVIIPIEQVKEKMKIIVKEGKQIPIDGEVISGFAMVNEAILTGESKLIEKNAQSKVFAGTFIETGTLIIKVEKIGHDTFFGRITQLIKQAEKGKAQINLFADKIALLFVPAMLIFILLVWLITANLSLVVTLLVFGSPLELTLVTPLAMLSGIIAAFRHGVLIKGGIFLERLASINTIIFDKTGTLTVGQPEIITIEILDHAYTEIEIVKILAIAEKYSSHVIAKAILKKAKQEKLEIPDPTIHISYPNGIEIVYNNEKYLVGNLQFIEQYSHGKITDENFCKNHYSCFYLANNLKLIAIIYVKDILRSEAKIIIDKLKSQNINVVLLSGDKRSNVEYTSKELGIKEFYAQMLPEQKFNKIKELQKKRHKIAMVGERY